MDDAKANPVQTIEHIHRQLGKEESESFREVGLSTLNKSIVLRSNFKDDSLESMIQTAISTLNEVD